MRLFKYAISWIKAASPIIWLLLSFVIASLIAAYLFGKSTGKTQVREQAAISQVKVSEKLLVTQQQDRQELGEAERALSAQRYEYDVIQRNNKEVQAWGDVVLSECVSALSGTPSVSVPRRCSMSARPDANTAVGNTGQSQN